MRGTKAKEIRRVLALPRVPKAMSASDRWFYRTTKRRYSATPAPQRESYLDNASAIHKAIKAGVARRLGDQPSSPPTI